MKNVESLLESLIFRSRWLLAPFFLGLIVAILALFFRFSKELLALVVGVLGSTEYDFIVDHFRCKSRLHLPLGAHRGPRSAPFISRGEHLC